MQIDWWTLGLQAVNFLILVWVLQYFLFKPVQRAIDRRRAQAEGAFAEAGALGRAAEQARAECERKADELEAERRQMVSALRQEADREKEKVLDAAHTEAAGLMEAARRQMAGEEEALSRAYREGAAGLAVDLATALLRGSAAPPVAETALARVVAHLGDLDETGHAALMGPAKADGTVVTVITWPALDAAARDRWRTRLAPHLSADATVDFADDAGLLAGARVDFPGASVDVSWSGTLEHAAAGLAGAADTDDGDRGR